MKDKSSATPIRPWSTDRGLARNSLGACRILQLTTLRQRHDSEHAADVCEIMGIVLVERAREPSAAVTLIRLDPSDALLDGRIARRDPGAPENVNREAGGIAVAGVEVLAGFFIRV